MQHRTLEQLRRSAAIEHIATQHAEPMPQRQRLERWAYLLRQRPNRRLHSLPGTEFVPPERRNRMRHSNSPISVAFADPLLRAAGMRDDSYGEAKRFFGISDAQLHNIVCFCRSGEFISAAFAGYGVRAAIVTSAPPNLVERAIRRLIR
jgi:hypothetical protein